MSTTIVSYTPNFRFPLSPLNTRLQPLTSISFLKLPTSKPIFLPHPVYHKNRTFAPKTMTELIRASAYRTNDDIEGFGGVETEAILNIGSSEFRPGIKSGGLESTLNSLSKWLVAVLFGGAILWRHDAETLWAAMGSIINVLLSVTLKQILNQERPFPTSKSDPGMPSSHAQSIFFAVIFVIMSMVKFLGVNGLTVAAALLALASGSYFSWLRVSLQHHTINQVIVGAIVGSFFSVLWFQIWDIAVLNAFTSYLWVRALVMLGSVGFCLGFIIYVVQHWLSDEQQTV